MMHVGIIQKEDEPEPAKVQLYQPRDIFYFKNQEECQRVSRLREKHNEEVQRHRDQRDRREEDGHVIDAIIVEENRERYGFTTVFRKDF